MNKLANIFDIEYGQREYHSKGFLLGNFGKTPLISSGGQNNGIYGYFDIVSKFSNVISVPNTGTIGHAFYQKNECCIDDNCLVLKPKIKLSYSEFIYYVLIIRSNKYRFMYGRQITPKKLGDIIIPDKIPDFIYSTEIPDYSNIKNKIIKEKIDLSDREFKFFEIQELFDVKGTKTTKKEVLEKYGEGKYAYVSTQSSNNGVAGFYDYYTEDGGILTIDSAVVGFCSYQENNFSASDHVEKLVPKFDMNKYVALFLTTIINKEQYRYNYGRKFNQLRIKNTKIKLPVDKDGNIDLKFMEKYIKSLDYSASL